MNSPGEVIHISRMQQEILLQIMIKNPIFKYISVEDLNEFARTASARMRNYQYFFDQNPPKKLRTDKEFCEGTYIFEALLQECAP